MIYSQNGQIQEAENQYQTILKIQADHPEANYSLGLLALQRNQPLESLPYFEAAVDKRPEHGPYWLAYIDALDQTGQSDIARQIFEMAQHSGLEGEEVNALATRLGLRQEIPAERPATSVLPESPQINPANNATPNQEEIDTLLSLYQQGRITDCENLAHSILNRFPNHGFSWKILGALLKQQNRLDEAILAMRQAALLLPQDPEALNNLGLTLKNTGNLAESESILRLALDLNGDFAEAYNNLGVTLMAQGRLTESEECFRQALHIQPEYAEAYCNLGTNLKDQGQFADSESNFQHALRLRPSSAEAYNNLGNLLQGQGRLSEAEANLHKALELKPEFAVAYNNLANTLHCQGHLEDSEFCYRKAMELKPDFTEAYDGLLFVSNYDPDKSADELFELYREYDARFGHPHQNQWKPHTNNRDADRCLKVGYVSPSFYSHPVFHFLEPLLAHHDKSRFEIFAYSETIREDPITTCYKQHVDHWISSIGLSDDELAERIRSDEIDILIDLAGHTGRNRLPVFSRKPAPVSLHWLDFGYTTGLSAIDYYLTDIASAPIGSENLFSEQLWRLSTPALAYRPATGMGQVSPLPAVQHGHITFGTLTRAIRINHRTIRVWSEILHQIKGSRLVIDSGSFKDPSAVKILIEKFVAHDIGKDRLDIGYHSPPWDVLRNIDIGLDCFPHNSGTTLFENLYMGVPFITLADKPGIGRLGCSLLEGVGHPEWITRSENEYIEKAIALASDLPGLTAVRAGLREEMQQSPLMDEKGFTERVEGAYRKMFKKWCTKTLLIASQSGNIAKTVNETPPDISEDAIALYNSGVDSQQHNRLNDAKNQYIQTVNIRHDFAEAYNNLGVVFQQEGLLIDAEASFLRALAIKPNYADAYYNLANTYKLQQKFFEAETNYRKVIAILPDYTNAHYYLGNILQEQGRPNEAETCLRQALSLNPNHINAFSTLLFALNYHPAKSSEEIFQVYQEFNARFYLPLKESWLPHANNREQYRRLKVGYVAPDYRKHPARYFLEPLLAHHDKRLVETYAYIELSQDDAATDLFHGYVEHWLSTAGLTDDQLSERIRDDAIDILVDLAGHTAGNRLGVFARKPAPVSLHWLDFGYTTGLTAIDYYLTDNPTIPPGNEHFFSETPWRLETPALAYRPPNGTGPVNTLPAQKNGHITFGTLTRAVRINHRTIRVWSEILKRCEGSRLIINSGSFREAAMQEALADQFSVHGIERERLDIGCQSPPWDVLRKIDIGLDCFPHNSGTTLIESLYMGVPYITLADRPSVGRLGSSILEGIGHPEWIAGTEDEYTLKAVALAADLPKLAAIRMRLREDMKKSPLMDEPGFARKVETAYQEMFKRWCDSEQMTAMTIDKKMPSQTIHKQKKHMPKNRNIKGPHPASPSNTEIHRLTRLFDQGLHAEAIELARSLTTRFPHHGFGWKVLGPLLHQQGLHEEAILAMKQAAIYLPHDPDAQYNLGIAQQHSGLLEEAEHSYRLALQLNKNYIQAQYNLGNILKEKGRPAEAESCYRHILRLKPDFFEVHCNLGNILRAQGRFSESVDSYRSALRIRPDSAELYNNLSLTLKEQGLLAEAETACKQALKLKPDFPEAHNNLGLIYHEQKRLTKAEVSYRQALVLTPNYAIALNNLGLNLQEQGRLTESENYYQQALTISPDFNEAYRNRGILYQKLGRLAESENSYRQALALKADDIKTLNNLAVTLYKQGRNSEAETTCRMALELDPNYVTAHNSLGNILINQGQLTEAEKCLRHVLEITPDYAEARSNLLFVLNYHPDMSGEDIFKEYKMFNTIFGIPWQQEWQPHTNNRIPNRRLKVGYVAPQLRRHSARHFLEPLLAHHDKEKFEVYAYAELFNEDDQTLRYKTFVDHWITTTGMSDAAVAAKIREDDIDILVDLAGHTDGNRLEVFARKPAPVSLHWLDFGYTTGLTAIDYYLTDKATVPKGSEALFSETPWRIETPCLAYRPAEGMGDINPLPVATRGYVTFGTLTRAARINHRTIRVWSEILKQVAGSHLVIDSGDFKDPNLQEALANKFIAHGIERERLEIGFHSPPWDVLRGLDIGFDCFPHNSGTTLFETLYMGVPFITLAGRPSVGRLGCSILEGIGHPEWIACTEEEYIELAVALAADQHHLASVRAGLRQEMEQSPLMDEPVFTHKVEQAYQEMFAKWCENKQSVLPQTEDKKDDKKATASSLQAVLNEAENFYRQRQFPDAKDGYQKVLAQNPEVPELHYALANTLVELGQLEEAEASYRKALELKPDFAEALGNLGNTLQRQCRILDAETCYQHALEIKPDFAEGYFNLGNLLREQNRLAESQTAYQKAIQIKPDYIKAYSNLGVTLQMQGQLAEAENNYRKAIKIQPDFIEGYINLGACLKERGLYREAEKYYKNALTINPDFALCYSNLGSVLKEHGQLSEAERCLRRALELNPDYPEAHSNLLFLLNYHPDRSAEEIYEEYKTFNARFSLPLQTTWQPHANNRQTDRRLKIGYVSPQFRLHSIRHFFEPLLAHHDKQRVEIFAYAENSTEDALTDRYKSYTDHWRVVAGLSNAVLAEKIRTDGIDILIDLAGHTANNRLLMFALKPAPVSLHWLDFGYTTGLTAIDYYLTDKATVPEGSEGLFSEKPWRIETPSFAYRPAEGMGDVSLLPALTRGYVTFGTLTRAVRINHRTILVWAEILKQVEGSHLVIDSSNFRDTSMQEELADKFIAHGIDRERLEIGYHSPPWDVLRGLDISLDCFPHNSGTTLFETLYMGVPFITLADRPSVGRLGCSILEGLGHPEWIARTEEEYVQLAVALAVNLPKLATIRSELRQEMQDSQLMNEPAFACRMETAYREMFAKWCEDQQPILLKIEDNGVTAESLLEILHQADTLYQSGQLLEAKAVYHSLLEIEPQHPEANYRLGCIAVALQQPSAALPYFETAIDVRPEHGPYWLAYIDALDKAGQSESARQLLEMAIHSGLNGDEVEILKIRLATLPIESPIENAKRTKPTKAIKKNKSNRQRNAGKNSANPQPDETNSLVSLFQQGNLVEAEAAAFSLIERFPRNNLAWKVLGAIRRQQGLFDEALSAMEKAIAIMPKDYICLRNIAVLLCDLGKNAEAESYCRRALAMRPDYADAHNTLSIALRSQKKLPEAEHSCRRALRLKPDCAETFVNLGLILNEENEFAEAEACYRKALELNPNFAEAYCGLSITLQAADRIAEAESACRQALILKPDYAAAYNSLGGILNEQEKYDEAETVYRQALKLKPSSLETLQNLAKTLYNQNKFTESESCCRQVLEIKPDNAEVCYNLGNALAGQEKHGEAEASFKAALKISLDYPEASINLGNSLRAQGWITEAEKNYRSVLQMHPDNKKAYNNLGNILQEQGRLDESEIIFRSVLESNPDFAGAFGNLLFLLNYHPDKSGEEIYQEYIRFNERFGLPLREEWKPHANSRTTNRRLKVGYVSPQFCQHPVCNFLEPLMANHNKDIVELYAYAESYKEDDTTDRYRSYVDHWIPTKGLTDTDMAERIRSDGIDILVDLAGHTGQNRLLVFARKPAPISLHWLDFGYTTGLPAIDYYLADSASVPEGSEGLFAETPWKLATPCLAYRPNKGMGEVNALPAHERGYITFGSLSRAVRINHRTIRVWSEILKQVKGSHLVINSGNFKDPAMQNVLAEKFVAHGIDRDRLEIGCNSPPWDVLRSLDIGFDCFPHNSGTTLFETLYMGIPFITLAGRASVGRLGCSVLEGLGHPEWIANSEEEYIERAVALAVDLPRLTTLRAGLRQEMEQSPLMDEPAFTRKVEAAYNEMFMKWCEEQR
ncbi:MAG: tetratricopeptide repeat protein [Desulfocapsaceae bacterium]|nr:tetratricopeptide repeat protein [Desulfocapsaceae bacterium]